jgi:hypothetical protein
VFEAFGGWKTAQNTNHEGGLELEFGAGTGGVLIAALLTFKK